VILSVDIVAGNLTLTIANRELLGVDNDVRGVGYTVAITSSPAAQKTK